MDRDKIILMSITRDELSLVIQDVVRQELLKIQKKKNENELLNFKQTCSWLGIHPSTLNKWKAENKIPFKKLGKRVFFQKKDILSSLKDSNYFDLHKLKSNKW